MRKMLATVGMVVLWAGAIAAQTPPPTQRIGNVQIDTGKTGTLTLEQNPRKKVTDVLMVGSPVRVTSARYDLTAPRITLLLAKNRVQRGTATGGGVVVNLRNPEAAQNSTLHCGSAVYTETTAADGATGHLKLTGGVRSVLHDPQFATPLETVSNDADIDLLPDGTNRVRFSGLRATGTPIEPPAPAKVPAKRKVAP